MGTGEVFGDCKPTRNGEDFLTFLKQAVAPHQGKEIHVVLDNLSTHSTPAVESWLAKNPNITFHFTLVGSSWINQIENWFSRSSPGKRSCEGLSDRPHRQDR